MDEDPAKLFDLSGRVVVLTGAASGIGRATAQLLSDAGASLVLGDLNEAGLRQTAERLGARGERTVLVPTDVAQRAQVEALVGRAVEAFGRVDIMANIAGILLHYPIVDYPEAELDRILGINLKGTFFGCQAALRAMIPLKSGCIVNIASQAIDGAGPGGAGYSISKAGVAMLTKIAAMEGAPHNIRVNTVAPGFVESPMTSPRWGDPAALAGMVQRIPLGRPGQPEDIARTILFLCSDASSWMTGQILRPNGGGAMPW
jgi:3-oxoacyl-[acyl-carrier protein] reductase